MVGALGYTVFLPGNWSTENFLIYYMVLMVDIVIFTGYKLIKRTKFVKSTEADITTGLEEVLLHEQAYLESLEAKGKNANVTIKQKILDWVF